MVLLCCFPNLLLLLEILKSAHAFLRDESTKSFLDLIRDTHSMKDTLTITTGAVAFHHSLDRWCQEVSLRKVQLRNVLFLVNFIFDLLCYLLSLSNCMFGHARQT